MLKGPETMIISMAEAFVLVSVDLGAEEDMLEQISSFKGVKESSRLYGVYDIIARIEADTAEAVKRLMSGIRQLAGVRSAMTMLVIG